MPVTGPGADRGRHGAGGAVRRPASSSRTQGSRPGSTRHNCRRLWRRRPGNARARRVAAFADGGGQSVGESRSRILLARHGIPPPVLQWPVHDPQARHVGTTDFGWPDLRTVGEFDGLIKYGRLLRPGQTPGDAVVAEKRREDRVRDEGLHVVRWTWDELDNPDVVVDLRRRLRQGDPALARGPGRARCRNPCSPRTPRGGPRVVYTVDAREHPAQRAGRRHRAGHRHPGRHRAGHLVPGPRAARRDLTRRATANSKLAERTDDIRGVRTAGRPDPDRLAGRAPVDTADAYLRLHLLSPPAGPAPVDQSGRHLRRCSPTTPGPSLGPCPGGRRAGPARRGTARIRCRCSGWTSSRG